jgi:hypothetical protein
MSPSINGGRLGLREWRQNLDMVGNTLKQTAQIRIRPRPTEFTGDQETHLAFA